MPTYFAAEKMEHLSTSSKRTVAEAEMAEEKSGEYFRPPNLLPAEEQSQLGRRSGNGSMRMFDQERLSRPKIKRGHWLDLYQQQVASAQNDAQDQVLEKTSLIRGGAVPLVTLNDSGQSDTEFLRGENIASPRSSLTPPSAVPKIKPPNFFRHLFFGKEQRTPKLSQAKTIPNQGTAPVEVNLMRHQIKIGNIVAHHINIFGGLEILKNIIKNPKGNEFIFALSQKKGLRILEKPRVTFEFEEEAFHHQNIFMNDNDIVSAGVVFVENGKILFTNFSGHFKPSYESLFHIKNYLKDIGFKKSRFEIKDYRELGRKP